MSFLKKLASLFAGGAGSEEAHVQHVYLRCNACGEPLSVRIDTRNDLSPEWHDTSASGPDRPDYYTCRKTVIGGGRCYRSIDVEMTFDRNRRLESQHAAGGTVLTEEEYAQAVAEWEAKKGANQ